MSTKSGTIGAVDGPRWLDDRQQRAWRGYLAMQAQLQARLNRRLQAESGLSLASSRCRGVKRIERWFEVVTAIILGVVAVATA